MFVSQIQVLGVLVLHVRRTYHERFAVKEVSRIVYPIGGGPSHGREVMCSDCRVM